MDEVPSDTGDSAWYQNRRLKQSGTEALGLRGNEFGLSPVCFEFDFRHLEAPLRSFIAFANKARHSCRDKVGGLRCR
jgi:hypothetical protein